LASFNFNFFTVWTLLAVSLVLIKLEITKFLITAFVRVDAFNFDVLKQKFKVFRNTVFAGSLALGAASTDRVQVPRKTARTE
jgi:hypothetical protein